MAKRKAVKIKKKKARIVVKLRSNCPKCKYSWVARKKKPKVCPRCKTRLDWIK